MARIISLPVQLILLASCLGHTIATSNEARTLRTTISEVTPGPGMPSLASLNLTSAGIFSKAVSWSTSLAHDYESNLKASFVNTCPMPNATNAAPILGCQECYYYLLSLGSQNCATIAGALKPGGTQGLVSAGGCGIKMTDIGQATLTQTSCSDVAYAVKWAIDNCPGKYSDIANNNVTVLGRAAAQGNENLIVDIGAYGT